MSLEERVYRLVTEPLADGKTVCYEGKEVTQVDAIGLDTIRIYFSPFVYLDRDARGAEFTVKRGGTTCKN